jgi:RNA polymerase sigma-70 factor (sigma-E family)
MTTKDGDGGALSVDRSTSGGETVRSESFDAVVLDRYRALARMAYLMTGDRETAQDVVAEAFARSWMPWQGGTVDELGPYVRRTVVNLCLQGQRRRFLERRSVQRIGARPPTTTVEPDLAVAHLVDLRRALQALSVEHRAVVVLRFFADLSEKDTAQVLQLSMGTVKSRTARALKALRPLMGATDHG